MTFARCSSMRTTRSTFKPAPAAAASALARASSTARSQRFPFGPCPILEIESHTGDRCRSRADGDVENVPQLGQLVDTNLDRIARDIPSDRLFAVRVVELRLDVVARCLDGVAGNACGLELREHGRHRFRVDQLRVARGARPRFRSDGDERAIGRSLHDRFAARDDNGQVRSGSLGLSACHSRGRQQSYSGESFQRHEKSIAQLEVGGDGGNGVSEIHKRSNGVNGDETEKTARTKGARVPTAGRHRVGASGRQTRAPLAPPVFASAVLTHPRRRATRGASPHVFSVSPSLTPLLRVNSVRSVSSVVASR